MRREAVGPTSPEDEAGVGFSNATATENTGFMCGFVGMICLEGFSGNLRAKISAAHLVAVLMTESRKYPLMGGVSCLVHFF